MAKSYQQKIDIYAHILPTRYKEALLKELPEDSYWRGNMRSIPPLSDVEHRFRIMGKFEGLLQVLTTSAPPVESFDSPEKSVELARIANDGLAELVSKYPERFVAAVACLPMNDMDSALKEADRAINDLKFRGILMYTPVNDKPLDSPEFMPLYEKMSQCNLPIWIHPLRPESYADYRTESKSNYKIYLRLGWPFETTVAMARLVYSGILERYPNLKFITHHCGGMVPFFASRLIAQEDSPEMHGEGAYATLTKPMIEYFKMFYADTANLSPPALVCGYQFFGADHILFGTDMPHGAKLGYSFVRNTIDWIEQMDLSDAERAKIFEGNARELLHLPC